MKTTASRLAIRLATLLLASSVSGATFTSDTVISPTDRGYDGQDVVVSNCVLTVDGEHRFSSVQLLTGAVLTHTFAPSGLLPGRVAITNEAHQLSYTNATKLLSVGVLTNTIVVRDSLGQIIYQSGVDYEVISDGELVFTSLQLLPGSAIPDRATVLVDYEVVADIIPSGLNLSVTGNVVVTKDARVDVDGRGYGGAMGPGAGTSMASTWTPNAGSGAGHGGQGGASSTAATPGKGYGSALQPETIGSGGGHGYNAIPGGAGGGSIHLLVEGTLELEGAITARGANGFTLRSGGGAGGSIWIEAQTISGTGIVSAGGGNAEPNSGGGGGGGRIALYATTCLFAGSVSAFGGEGFVLGGPGSVFRRIGSGRGELVYDNAGRRGMAVLSISQGETDLTVRGGTVLAIGGVLYQNSLMIGSNAWVSTTNVSMLVISNATIEAGGGITADGAGYGPGQGPGGGKTYVSGYGYPGSGGGYGGHGGAIRSQTTYSLGGAGYGSVSNPADMGSGGGVYSYSPSLGNSRGGGAIHMIVRDTLVCNGSISVQGTPGAASGGGGGSGGSVWLDVGTLAGAGSITADGGNGDGTGLYAGGGGGGGRIAVYSGLNLFFGTLSAKGGTGFQAGGAGTIYSKARMEPISRILADNGGQSGTNTHFAAGTTFNNSELTVRRGATTELPSGQLAGLFVGASSWITVLGKNQALDLTIVGNLTVESGGGVLLDSKGDTSGQGQGRGGYYIGNGVYMGGGGGHGGYGGSVPGALVAIGGNVYGSITGPMTTGSSGGGITNGAGGAGGGAVKLTVGGSVLVNGVISANGGESPSTVSGGGSGGSIWIDAGTIAGQGALRADGGKGSLNGGGGGGGRISVTFYTNAFAGTVSAAGGEGAVAGGAGTIYLKPRNRNAGALVVDNQGRSGTNTLIQTQGTVDAAFVGGARVTLVAPAFTSLLVGSNSWLFVTNQPLLISSNLTVVAGGVITADSTGYASDSGPGAGRSFTPSLGGGGGGYGGYGGSGAFQTGRPNGGPAYGNATSPQDLGSGGGSYNQSGGRGGGSVRLTVNGPLTLDGVISANGGMGASTNGGGGSGGSIWITAGTLAGSGLISADGGSGGGLNAGGGGGGRIAATFNANAFSGRWSAKGGMGAMVGGAGTIYLKQNYPLVEQLVVDNGGRAGTNTSWSGGTAGEVTVGGGASLVFTAPITVASLSIGSNAAVIASGQAITVNGNATISAGGAIVADRTGYSGGSGPGAGRTYTVGSGSQAGRSAGGGGYGGYGGNGPLLALPAPSSIGGNAYGSITAPADNGSGGGSSYNYSGGAGGGTIRLTVKNTLLIQGLLSANGGNGTDMGDGGGSGGSIWITTGTLAGNGVIRANGGNGINAGGGGGGRIAVYSSGNVFTGTITAVGGEGANTGGAGTVYVKENGRQFGQLIVDNGGRLGTNTPVTGNQLGDLLVSGGGIAAPSVSPSSFYNVVLSSNGWIWLTNQTISISGNLTVEAGAGIIANGAGYRPGQGPGGGASTGTQSANVGGGAGHGGYGVTVGQPISGGSGAAYGSVTTPVDRGSGGGGVQNGGGYGGGAVQVTVNGTLLLNGTITANGMRGQLPGGGGGSGGSILLTVNGLSGSGSIAANGGDGNGAGGPGGAGRVAVYYAANTFFGSIEALGGRGQNAYGGAGTIYLKNKSEPSGLVIVDNGGQAGTNTLLVAPVTPFDLKLCNGAVVWPAMSSLTVSNLLVSSGAVLTCQGWASNFDLLVQGNARVESSSGITVDGKGYLIGAGPGAGLTANGIGSGAGHGGAGGVSSLRAGGVAYGNGEEPLLPGSGGGWGTSVTAEGSQGGGALRVTVGGTFTLDGYVSGNGGHATTDDAGGGSGGSVWLVAQRLMGKGEVSAKGGNGNLWNGGGGAGGRIAVYSPGNNFAGTVSVTGGTGFAPGQTGSVFTNSSVPAPNVLFASPTGPLTQSVSFVEFTFSTPIDPLSVSADDFSVVTPTGTLATAHLQLARPGPALVRVSFPTQIEPGTYLFSAGTNIQNVFGQALANEFVGSFGLSWPWVTGRVIATNNQPIPNVFLQAEASGFNTNAITDADGSYALQLPPGTPITVTPRHADTNVVFIPSARYYSDLSDVTAGQDYKAVMAADMAFELSSSTTSNQLTVTWIGTPGVMYNIQLSADLIEWVEPNTLGMMCTQPGQVMTFSIPIDRSQSRSFFRIHATY